MFYLESILWCLVKICFELLILSALVFSIIEVIMQIIDKIREEYK